MEDLVSMCERRCRKACNLRSAAEDSDEACHSGSSGGRARRYRKRGSPKSAARDAGAMDTDPSPVRLWESEGHSESYRTAYQPPSESEMSIARAHTAPESALQHDAEGLERPARARTAPVPRHTGPETDAIGDTPMGDESEVPGTVSFAESGGKHAACHCEHVSFLMGKYPKMGMDAIVHRLDRLDNAKDGLEEDVAGILDDQSAAENHMEELRADQARYRENLELALQKQQQVVDSLLHLVEDMSGRLRRLEERQPLASGPELPAKPAAVELVERVKTLRSAMEKPMGGPAEAPYAPPRVDPGALPFVPMFSESTMLGEHTAPAGSMREGHVTTDPRSLTVQMSHAAQDVPITMGTGTGHGKKEGATTESPVDGQDQPKIYTIRDHTLEVLMHPDVLELHAVRVVHTPHGDERQLHLKVRVRCGREEKMVDVLVDTGAQVSLVRRGLFKEEFLQPSRRPVRRRSPTERSWVVAPMRPLSVWNSGSMSA